MRDSLCILFFLFVLAASEVCHNNGPLGMINKEIEDWQITASSSYPSEWDAGCSVSYARPYLDNRLGWCARIKSSSEWLQIDIGVVTTVTAILTQGRGDGKEWVTGFLVSYSSDGELWTYITEENGSSRVFKANVDSYSVEHVYLPAAVEARFVKLHVQSWNKHPSMRAELIGCQDNKKVLGQLPYGQLQASSSHYYRSGSSCQASDGHILSSKAWCAADNNKKQWLQLDIGPPTKISALITKGRGDTGRKQWVTKYKISYSNDSVTWTFYKDSLSLERRYTEAGANHSGIYAKLRSTLSPDGVVEFGGNIGKDDQRTHFLAKPIMARFVRFHPIDWNRGIAMRVAVMGKQHRGECGVGFTRPNSASPCVENIAFKKETWLNKERHNKRALVSGSKDDLNKKLAEKAVDGNITNALDSCAILDNYYDTEPQLTIDLGVRRDVSGVVVYLWEGQNGDSEAYKNYALNLEALSIYVSSGKTGETLCGRIQNKDNAFQKEREQKLICSRRIYGRYIRVQPEARGGWYTNWYSAVICEVMAFT
ncbi:lactadherin-like [Watersipora subatra]|uniref:lactadherin-like n=1 Tax=Watersipora subatra TaxID=2589382 RepID=UPI00355C2C45